MVREIYIIYSGKSRRGLSELRIKKLLERHGYSVWRSENIDILDKEEIYTTVRIKYARLMQILERKHPGAIQELRYINYVHHGLPDFIVYNGKFKFVECKYGYEPLTRLQRKTINRLIELGFTVEVFRLANPRVRTLLSEIDLATGKRIRREVQERLDRFK